MKYPYTYLNKAKLFLLLLLVMPFYNALSNTYYFSESAGDDSRSSLQAQHASTPWRSLNKLNDFMANLQAGDSVLFKRGEVFAGSIYAKVSGAGGRFIVFSAYGQGSKPVITGFASVSGWAQSGNGIWEAAVPSDVVNILLLNGNVKAKGRYPNVTAPNNGFLTLENAAGQNQITDEQLPSLPDWTGGSVTIRKNRWVLDNDPITLHSGNTINFISSTDYAPSRGYGYFIQDHLLTLDVPGEWYFNTVSKKIYVCMDVNPSSNTDVRAGTGSHLVQLVNQGYLHFEELRFEGANMNAFHLSNASQIKIINCDIFYTGINAINAESSNELQIERCTIGYSNNIALNANNCSGLIIRSNTISCTGIFAGMGQNNSGSYEAIILKGNNNLVEYNSIDSTGYIPITFAGNNVIIKNNFINSFAFVKDDGGGIYTWNNVPGAAPEFNRSIAGNIILNGRGAGAGTDDPASERVHGIYIDDNSANLNIIDNTIANSGEYGIFIHNARDLAINRNTVYNNYVQIVLAHDNAAAGAPVKNVLSTGNIFFSKLAGQRVAEYRTINNDLNDFGTFDSNYYCRPIDDNLVIYASYRVNGTYQNMLLDLQGWQALHNKDLHSNKSPVRIAPYTINNFVGDNKYGNGNFNNDIGGLYVYATAGNGIASWTNSGGLDNGALKVQFTSQSASYNQAYVIIGIGSISANKNYILRFSLKGTNTYKNMQVFLRKSLSPYNDLSERKFRRIRAGRTENEFLLSASATENDASIVIELEEQPDPVYFDNVQLYESNITLTNPNDSIRFEYNASTSAKTIVLDGSYIDAKRNIYTSSITLSPYASAVLIKLQNLAVLPLQFLSFRGMRASDRVNLQWTTSHDTTTGYYEVERSATANEFVKIGRADINTPGIYAYQYSDLHPLNGSNYYRLRYMSGNRQLYSNIIRIDYQRSKKALRDLQDTDMLLHPNPATNTVHVVINASSITQLVTLNIQTIAGRIVRSLPLYLTDNQASLDISFLKPGTYTIRFICDGKVLVRRFVKAS